MTLEIGKAYTIMQPFNEVFAAGLLSDDSRTDICAKNFNRCLINLHCETVVYEGIEEQVTEFAIGKFAVDEAVIRTIPNPYAQWIINNCASETHEGMVTIYISLDYLHNGRLIEGQIFLGKR